MTEKIIYIIQLILITLVLIGYKHILGFNNAVCFISAIIIIELWKINKDK